MTDLYRGHDAKYWHGRYVKATNVYLESLLELFRHDPNFMALLFDSLDDSMPGWRETMDGFLNGQRRPFHPQSEEISS